MPRAGNDADGASGAVLSIVCWKWSRPGYRSTFTGEHVNRLAAMVRRHYARPHRFICVTDDASGIDAGIEVLPPWDDFADVPSPHGGSAPSCYRRLRAFHPDAAQWFGERFVSIDLDTVIVQDVAPLWDRPEDFVAWRDPFYGHRGQYCGSMMLLRAGARPGVWSDFDPKRSPAAARAAGFRGSDQAWVSYRLPGEATWSEADGVLSYRRDIKPRSLPAHARIVMFHGAVDPWHPEAQRLDWVREHWAAA